MAIYYELVRIYCCLDRESRESKTPGFELKTIIREIHERNIKSVLSIDKIIATQQIESWFFWDMETIYKYLKVARSRRKKKAYRPPEKYTYHDMIKLFRSHGKIYNKGKKRCGYFIQQLNLNTIISNCRELREGIEKIKSHFKGANYVFHMAALADIVPSIVNPTGYHQSNVDGGQVA